MNVFTNDSYVIPEKKGEWTPTTVHDSCSLGSKIPELKISSNCWSPPAATNCKYIMEPMWEKQIQKYH